jgi:hypothetical protein
MSEIMDTGWRDRDDATWRHIKFGRFSVALNAMLFDGEWRWWPDAFSPKNPGELCVSREAGKSAAETALLAFTDDIRRALGRDDAAEMARLRERCAALEAAITEGIASDGRHGPACAWGQWQPSEELSASLSKYTSVEEMFASPEWKTSQEQARCNCWRSVLSGATPALDAVREQVSREERERIVKALRRERDAIERFRKQSQPFNVNGVADEAAIRRDAFDKAAHMIESPVAEMA